MVGRCQSHTSASPHLGPDSPTVKWALANVGYVAAIAAGGTIYTVGSGGLHAISPGGTEKWSVACGEFGAAIGPDGTVYVGHFSYSPSFCAIRPDGTTKWIIKDLSPFGPSIGADGTIYAGAPDGKLHGIGLDGSTKWIFSGSVGGSGYFDPGIGPDGTVYSGQVEFYAIHPDGTQQWLVSNGGLCNGGYPVIDADGTILLGCSDGVMAMTPDGKQKWSAKLNWVGPGDLGWYGSPVIASDGTLYVAGGKVDGPGWLVALTPNGTQKWMVPLSGGSASVGPVDAGGTVYIGTSEGMLAVAADGKQKWLSATGKATGGIMGSDGTLYYVSTVGNSNSKLYALGP